MQYLALLGTVVFISPFLRSVRLPETPKGPGSASSASSHSLIDHSDGTRPHFFSLAEKRKCNCSQPVRGVVVSLLLEGAYAMLFMGRSVFTVDRVFTSSWQLSPSKPNARETMCV